MKKLISVILVLVLCMMIPCTAFADEFVGSIEGGDGCDEHKYNNGICTECGHVCDHEYDHGVCIHCGMSKPLIVNGNPSTGDVIMFWVTVMLVALIALVAAVLVYRKKFSR